MDRLEEWVSKNSELAPKKSVRFCTWDRSQEPSPAEGDLAVLVDTKLNKS